ncbi:MAG: hypothetical protein JST08_01245 [Actinobacteria bacterium]|nr:hypothetical protein [Actinomycetota bacterium]
MGARVDETDARAYVATSARDCVADLGDLNELANYGMIEGGATLDPGRLSALGIDPEGAPEDQAEERLHELSLGVDVTTTFEVVLGAGGPDRRLCFECDRDLDRSGLDLTPAYPRYVYEIRRVHFRYSWSGSAEVELTGSDREVAEAFGRRVVPELAD